MSKFYTYSELKQRSPTKEAVSVARDKLYSLLEAKGHETITGYRTCIYGSSAWSFFGHEPEVHTRRSDIDVAVVTAPERPKSERPEPLVELCRTLSSETDVPIEITAFGIENQYKLFISPSTVDHFRILARTFPHGPYQEFINEMDRQKRSRADDLKGYIGTTRGRIFRPLSEKGIDLQDPNCLELLCKLENFPDHFIRKLLGMERMLPIPDSKSNTREAFGYVRGKWPVLGYLQPLFQQVFDITSAYEELIDDVERGTSGAAYNEKLGIFEVVGI
mgnify:CR=1 FL=1